MKCGSSDPELTKQFVALRQAIENLRKTMLAGDSTALQEHADKLAEFQQALFNDVRETFRVVARRRMTPRPCGWTICRRPCAISSSA